MQDVHTGEELIFICDRWMSRDEDDSDICRELAVSRDEDPLAGTSELQSPNNQVSDWCCVFTVYLYVFSFSK